MNKVRILRRRWRDAWVDAHIVDKWGYRPIDLEEMKKHQHVWPIIYWLWAQSHCPQSHRGRWSFDLKRCQPRSKKMKSTEITPINYYYTKRNLGHNFAGHFSHRISLHRAVQAVQLESVDRLINKVRILRRRCRFARADAHIVDKSGYRPIDLPPINRHQHVVDYILAVGAKSLSAEPTWNMVLWFEAMKSQEMKSTEITPNELLLHNKKVRMQHRAKFIQDNRRLEFIARQCTLAAMKQQWTGTQTLYSQLSPGRQRRANICRANTGDGPLIGSNVNPFRKRDEINWNYTNELLLHNKEVKTQHCAKLIQEQQVVIHCQTMYLRHQTLIPSNKDMISIH